MKPYWLPAALTCLTLIYPIYKSYLHGRENLKARLLFFMLLEGFWCFTFEIFIASSPPTEYLGLLYVRLMYVSVLWMGPTLLHMVATFDKNRCGLLLCIMYLPAAIFTFFLPTDLFISGVVPAPWGWLKTTGSVFGAFRLYMAFCVIMFFVLSYRVYKRGAPRIKNQIRYVCIVGTFPPAIAGALVLVIFPMIGYTKLNIGFFAYPSMIQALILTYAITKDRLFDLDISKQKRVIRQKMRRLADHSDLPSFHEAVNILSQTFNCAVGIETITEKTYLVSDGYNINRNCSAWRDVLLENPNTIIRHETNDRGIEAMLKNYHLDAVVPIVADGTLLVIVYFGVGLCESIYGSKERHLFERITTDLRKSADRMRLLAIVEAIKNNPVDIIWSCKGIYDVKVPHPIIKTRCINRDTNTVQA